MKVVMRGRTRGNNESRFARERAKEDKFGERSAFEEQRQWELLRSRGVGESETEGVNASRSGMHVRVGQEREGRRRMGRPENVGDASGGRARMRSR